MWETRGGSVTGSTVGMWSGHPAPKPNKKEQDDVCRKTDQRHTGLDTRDKRTDQGTHGS